MSDGLRNEPWLIAELDKILRDQHNAEQTLTRYRQARTAQVLGDNRRSMEGLGRPRLEVDSYSYNYWGLRLGYKCWKDPQFLREFERDNEACRVKSTGTRIQAGYGTKSSGATRKFSKSYG